MKEYKNKKILGMKMEPGLLLSRIVVGLVLFLSLAGGKALTTITVTSPSGGDYGHGDTVNIDWSSDSEMYYADIELWRNGSFYRSLADTITGGSMDWTIPGDIPESVSADLQIRVYEVTSQLIIDPVTHRGHWEYNRTGSKGVSGNFKVMPQTITVTQPTSSAEVREKDNLQVGWTSSLVDGDVAIELWRSNGSSYIKRVSNINNDGNYSFEIPTNVNTGSHFIRIEGMNGNPVDESETFSIIRNYVAITTTNGTSVPAGDPVNIGWNQNLETGTVRLDYRKVGQSGWTQIDPDEARGSSPYTWNTPDDLFGEYEVRVRSNANSWVDDIMTLNLTESIIVTGPGGDGSWLQGEKLTFNWTSNYDFELMDAVLLRDGSSYNVMADNDQNNGTIDWTIPNEVSPSSLVNFKVKIYEVEEEMHLEGDPHTGHGFDTTYTYNRTGIAGTSDTFTIAFDNYVDVSAPNTGITNKVTGEDITIKWATNVDPVTITMVGNGEVYTIKENYSSDLSPPDNADENTTTWTIPAEVSDWDYRIRITGEDVDEYSGTVRVGSGPGFPDRTIAYNKYDPHGNVTEATDANGQLMHLYYGTNTQPKTQSGTGVNGVAGVYLTGIERSGATTLDQTADYDTKGRVETITDPNGKTRTFSYDGLSRLTEVQNHEGDTVQQHTYIVKGSKFNSSSPNWVQTTQHTGADTLYSTKYIDGLGRTIQSQQRVVGENIVAATTYDTQGRKHKAYKAYQWNTNDGFDNSFDSHASSFYSGTVGRDTAYTEIQYESSPLNRPVKRIPKGGESQSGAVTIDYDIRSWNYNGQTNNYQVTTTTDESNKVTQTWTDGWGRKIRTVAAPGTSDEAETIFEYDPQGNLKKVIAPNGTETTYAYNAKGQVVRKTSADAGTSRYKYDEAGNLRFSQDANQADNGKVAFTSYDNMGRPVATGIASFNFLYLNADSTKGFESESDNFNGTWHYDTKPSSSAGNYPWSKFASLIDSKTVSNTQGRLVARAWRYGGSGIAESATVQGVGVVEDESYKAASTLEVSNTTVGPNASLTLESGSTITLKPGFHAESGSSLNATIDSDLSSAASEGISSMTGDNKWQMELYSYDDEGRVKDKWIWTGDVMNWATHLSYNYNRLGEVTRQKIEVGSEILYQHYTYNERGLLDKVYLTDDGTVDTEPAEITYTYTASGAVDQITYRNGSTTVTNGYDIRGRLTDINDINSTSGLPFAAKYEYKKNSNVDKAHFWNPNITTGINLSSSHRRFTYDYSYDDLSRLADADYQLDGSNPSAFDVPSITYDKAGNIDLLQRRDQAGTLVDDLDYNYTNGTNQLSSITDNASSSHSWDPVDGSFSYDGNGNLKSMTGNPELSDITYDHRNLPVHMYLPDSTEQINNYNADGQRILKEVKTSSGSTWSFYIKDGLSTLGLIQGGELQYLNILADGVSGRVVANSGAIGADNAKRYYIKDLIGSTRAVVDENGATTENRDYYPFGLLMDERQYVQGSETTEKFSGKERDDKTSFDYFGARYYMPGIGRFLSTDRFADKYPSLSTYQYAANIPTLLIDVNGDSVDVSHIDSEDLNLLKNSLSDITGLDLYVEDGYLLSSGEAKDKDGSSKTASSWLTNAINSKNVSNVYYQKKGKKGSSSINDNIYLDPVDIEDHKWAISGDLDPRTMGWGMTFLHELNHTSLVPGGPYEDNYGKDNPTGDVVDRLNKVRRELGPRFGQRKNYVPRFISEESYFNYIDFGKGRKIIRPPRTYEFNNEY